MKVRNGFVANSSTSSFVIIGIKKEFEDYEEMEKIEEKHDLYCAYEENIIGYRISDGSDWGTLNDAEFTIEELMEYIPKLKEIFGDDADIKLYMGTMQC